VNGKLTVHDATQMITSTAGSLARVFGLEPDQVRVLSPFVGGGFGGKGPVEPPDPGRRRIEAGGPAGAAGAEPRGRLSPGRGRTTTVQRVALGAGRDGRLDALIHSGVVAMTAHNNCPEQFTFPAPASLAARTFRLEQRWPTWTCWPTLDARARRVRSAPSRLGERDRRAGA